MRWGLQIDIRYELKKLLPSANVLKYIDFNKKFDMHTDANSFSIAL